MKHLLTILLSIYITWNFFIFWHYTISTYNKNIEEYMPAKKVVKKAIKTVAKKTVKKVASSVKKGSRSKNK